MKLQQAIKEMNKRKRMIAAVLSLSLAFTGIGTVSASVINDAKNKKSEAQQELNNVNNKINEIKAAQSDLQEEMEAYDDQLMGLLTDMDLLETDISNKQVEIDQANADLDVAEQQEQAQYEAMKTRIRYMYENGNSNYLEVLLGAESITDFLNRIEYVSDVYDYDRDQLTAYQETVQQVADLKNQLDNELAEMEDLEISYQEQESSLKALIAEKSAQMENFDSQLANAKSLASQYAATIREQNQIIVAERQRQAAEAAAAAAAAANAKKNQTKNNGQNGTQTANSGTANAGNNTDISTGGNTASDTSADNSSTGGSNSGTGLTSSDLNPSYPTGVSGSDVVAFASQYVGYPYKYGGNSLTDGADCSYFVKACFGQYGINLPRNSYALQSSGQAVSYENAQAGDIICYPGHVAIYMGNGRIVHAASPRSGICYGNATYRTILTVRRVL